MFLNYMKKVFVLLAIGLLASSCSEYQQMLRDENLTEKYVYAEGLYNEGRYKKALKLMEQIVPAYRGKPQAEKLMFMYANTFYELGDYILSGYQFERFETSYPSSDSVEIAAYRSARSYYELSPRYSLDQKDTYKALERLQAYVNKYPNSNYRLEANALVAELRTKLEKKEIENAKQLLKIGDFLGTFTPAIESFDNFISDHPGSQYRKDAFFGRLEAEYRLAINSRPSKMPERLEKAKEFYDDFIKYYGESDLRADADEILEDINKRMPATEESQAN